MTLRMIRIACLLSAFAAPAQAQSLMDAIAKGRPVIDLRARYEAVQDAGMAVDANVLTLRARLGYETGTWNGLSLQADFDQVFSNQAYNSTRNGKTAYAVVADPAMTALNRLQLTYASDFGTKFVLGRQRLLIVNQRFVGNAGWRQHEQTYDALSAVNNSIDGLTLNYAYLYRTNRQGMENYLLAQQKLPILRALSPEKRLQLFTDAFGDNIPELQKNFTNYIRTMPAHNP